jgi:hypothetical protein
MSFILGKGINIISQVKKFCKETKEVHIHQANNSLTYKIEYQFYLFSYVQSLTIVDYCVCIEAIQRGLRTLIIRGF